jgi:hypothetical protein
MPEKDPEPESLRLVYQTCCELHRYFLTWRHQLLAGYLATLAALGIAFGWTYDWTNNARPLASIVCLVGLFLTTIFWLLEGRNRRLYRECQNVASDIEAKFGFAPKVESNQGKGIYAALKQTKGFSHSRTIDILFAVAAVALLASAAYSFWFIR